ncbi:hypothetical protein EKO04_000602 [Ascochyta lentis]|uniref:Uncharacterized protein n=1 Tax=Ascochyta lentis TaxID=205686 RepID=A0A8H7MMX3_9PLEO|nr:hypothetical protein EKO04_000602 [Ascochyta lentis]
MDSTIESALHRSTPHAIIEDCDDHWRICFEPDIAGIIIDEPCLIHKAIISDLYPHLLEAWEAHQEQQKTEAHRIEQKFIAFTRRFNDDSPDAFSTPHPPEPGVACDQHLLPDMGRHWGDLRQCATHPKDHAPFHGEERGYHCAMNALPKPYGYMAWVIEAAYATPSGRAIAVGRLSWSSCLYRGQRSTGMGDVGGARGRARWFNMSISV